MPRKVVEIVVGEEFRKNSFAEDIDRGSGNSLKVEKQWPKGLKLIGVVYGWIKFDGKDRKQLTRPVTVDVPPSTRAIYVGITGVEMPTGTDAIVPVPVGGMLLNIVKNCDNDGNVIVSDGKFVFDARAVLLNGSPPGPWSMYVAVEIMCFAD